MTGVSRTLVVSTGPASSRGSATVKLAGEESSATKVCIYYRPLFHLWVSCVRPKIVEARYRL